MKLSYHTYAFGGRSWLPSWTLEEAIRITAELGFIGLELAAVRPHGFPEDLDKAERIRILEVARHSQLPFAAICPTSVNFNIASPVVGERNGTVKYIIECMDLALDLETRIVLVNGGWSVKPFIRKDAWEWAASGLSKLAREAENRGVTLAIEQVNAKRADVVVSTQDMVKMIREVGSPALRPMIDLYHMHLENENIIEVIKQLGTQIVYVHFLDAIRSKRARAIPGQGELDLVKILEALRNVGYEGWLTLEIWGDDPIDFGKKTVEFLESHNLEIEMKTRW